jgi:long-chain fatty acid transport protein
MKWWKAFSLFLILMLAAGTSFAAGFRLPEAGVKAMGMGFAFTAQADDPSAIYFNPAGLMQLQGTNMMIGGTYVYEKGGTFTGTTPVDNVFANKSETQKTLHFIIPNGYVTHTDKARGIAYGIGVFAPFGLGQEYSSVSTSIFRNQITKIDLQTVVVNPTIAFEIDEVLSIGFGIDYMYGMATLAKTPWSPALGGNLYNLELEGDGDAWGYNFGLLLAPSKEVKIGFNYRSPFHLEIKEGDVDIANINSTVPFVPNPVPPPAAFTAAQVFGGTSYATKGSTTIEIPATATLGISYTKNRLTVEVDADMTFWSSYKSLNIDIQNNNPLLPDSFSQKNWTNEVALYVGGEYRVTDPLALRLGFRYDPTPVPAATMGPELPDADKMYYCAGAGYKLSNWIFDVSYMYVDKQDRTVNNQTTPPPPSVGTGFNGTWSGDAHLVSLDVGYKF